MRPMIRRRPDNRSWPWSDAGTFAYLEDTQTTSKLAVALADVQRQSLIVESRTAGDDVKS